jgi:hypothetical protein
MGDFRWYDGQDVSMYSLLRTAAMLSPLGDPAELAARLAERGFQPVHTDEVWAKSLRLKRGTMRIIVLHNERAPTFHVVGAASSRRTRLTWFGFVENPADDAERDEDRSLHIKLLENECADLFNIWSYNFAYQGQSTVHS